MNWQQKFTTFNDMLEYALRNYPDNIVMADPVKNRYVRYRELADIVGGLSCKINGLADTDDGIVVSVFGENSMEWMFVFLSAVSGNNIIAPINHQLKDPAEITRLLTMSEASVIYVSRAFMDLFARVVGEWPTDSAVKPPRIINLEDECAPFFKKYVSNAKPNAGQPTAEQKSKDAADGMADDKALAPRKTKHKLGPDDFAILMFTSGSIKVKGVMHSQKSLLSNQQAAAELLLVANDNTLFVAGLPLSHTYGLLCGFVPLSFGSTAVYAPAPRSIPDYVSAACAMNPERGLMVAGVPELARIMNQKIMRSARGGSGKNMTPLKRLLSGAKYGAFLAMRRINYFTSRFLNLDLSGAFFKAIKVKFGNDFRMPIGGGPTDKITEFGLRGVGLRALSGYGTTEMAPLIAANVPLFNVIQSGTVGYVSPGVEVCIIDGEVCSRGPNMMLGYLKNEEATKKVMPGDGWYHTGDKGFFARRSLFGNNVPVDKPKDYIYTRADEDCCLVLRGRVDNQFANQRGENISPEVIENQLMSYEIISSCKVFESPPTFVTAHIFPDSDALNLKYGKIPEREELKQIFAQIVKQVNMNLQSGCGINSFDVKDSDFERNALGKIKRTNNPVGM